MRSPSLLFNPEPPLTPNLLSGLNLDLSLPALFNDEDKVAIIPPSLPLFTTSPLSISITISLLQPPIDPSSNPNPNLLLLLNHQPINSSLPSLPLASPKSTGTGSS